MKKLQISWLTSFICFNYHSVSYDNKDMDSFICELNSNIKVMSKSFHDNVSISVADVCEAVHKTKRGKREGCSELMSDHIKYGTHKLYVILTMLFNSINAYPWYNAQ